MVGEAPLPDFACVAVFALHSKREASLDELHRFFDGQVGWGGEQQVNVVGHNDEVVKDESSRTSAGAENVNEEHGVALRLEQTFAHPGLSCDEEGAVGWENMFGVRVAGECGHGWYSWAEALIHCVGLDGMAKSHAPSHFRAEGKSTTGMGFLADRFLANRLTAS